VSSQGRLEIFKDDKWGGFGTWYVYDGSSYAISSTWLARKACTELGFQQGKVFAGNIFLANGLRDFFVMYDAPRVSACYAIQTSIADCAYGFSRTNPRPYNDVNLACYNASGSPSQIFTCLTACMIARKSFDSSLLVLAQEVLGSALLCDW